MMQSKKKIFAICGSTRQNSSNLELLQAIAEMMKETVDMTIFREIATLPHFNPDDDNEAVSEKIIDFRNQIRASDGVLICTPEYAMGVPGTLKNALDWTVGSMEFAHKPTALITAATSGEKGHQSLLETLRVIEAKIDDKTELIISFVKTKIKDKQIIHPETYFQVQVLMNELVTVLEL
jgi:chromate reductase, NAD(P)H dehydrogenase (quinone)